MLAAYMELAHLGVDMTLDIKDNSVLLAPPCPPGLPSLPPPFTGLTVAFGNGCKHQLRIIDLDIAFARPIMPVSCYGRLLTTTSNVVNLAMTMMDNNSILSRSSTTQSVEPLVHVQLVMRLMIS